MTVASIRNRIIELRLIPAHRLLDNPKNWRHHPGPQRSALSQILEEIGWADACLAHEEGGELVLIDGHLRKDLAGGEVVPVLVLDVDEAEAETILASLDPLAGMASADPEALGKLMDAARVTEELRDELQRRYLHGMARIGASDEVPDLTSSPTVGFGELWQLGQHRLLCGDARKAEDVARVMDREEADIVWTDPPYGVDYVGKTSAGLMIRNDGKDDLPSLLHGSFAAIDAVIRAGAALYICHPAAHADTFIREFKDVGWRLHETLIWVKDRAVLGHADYHYRHEPILYGYKAARGRRGRGHAGWYGGDDQDTVFEIARPAASREHPTSKPVELVERCVDNSSRRGGMVLDPFAGSGTTVIAAERLGRRARLLEIDPAYADVIIRRWETFTDGKARRIDG
jgi:DNA modification methylase